MTAAPEVSDRARALLRGAFDTHVHIAPDVVGRRIDDLTLARRFADLGLAGFTLKSHYTSTAERAAVVRAAVPGVHVLGAIVLNRAVGGMNMFSRMKMMKGLMSGNLGSIAQPGANLLRTKRSGWQAPKDRNKKKKR